MTNKLALPFLLFSLVATAEGQEQLYVSGLRSTAFDPGSEYTTNIQVGSTTYQGVRASATAQARGAGTGASQTTTITYSVNVEYVGDNKPTYLTFTYNVHLDRGAVASLAPATPTITSGSASA